MYYCPGEYCSKKATCAHHCVGVGTYQYLDMSSEGFGCTGVSDNGNPFSRHEYHCGDLARDYACFEPVVINKPKKNVILIKWRSKWEDYDELVGIAANEAIAHKHTKELATKYPDCYGDCYGAWYFEDFNLIEE